MSEAGVTFECETSGIRPNFATHSMEQYTVRICVTDMPESACAGVQVTLCSCHGTEVKTVTIEGSEYSSWDKTEDCIVEKVMKKLHIIGP
jgi:hypothetical protein